MKLRIALFCCASIVTLGAAHGLHAAELTAGHDYYSVQLLSAKSADALRPALAAVAGEPHARIDQRGAEYMLRVGYWESRGDAALAARALVAKFPTAYVRLAAYRSTAMMANPAAGSGASASPPARARESAVELAAAAQSNVQSSSHTEQPYLVPNPEIPRRADTANARLPPHRRSARPPSASARHAPDEAPLWALLREQRYADLEAALTRSRTAFPGWSPPERLVALLHEGQTNARITHAIESRDWNGLAALAQQYPQYFDCSHIDHLWALAEAHHALGNGAQTLATYQRIIPLCPKAADRIATLYKARERLPADDYAALLQREAQAGPRDVTAQTALDQITYDYRVGQFLQAVKTKEPARAIGLLAGFEPALRAKRDARNAALVGWVYFDAGQTETAAAWFDTALGWEPALDDARYGYALANFKLQRLDVAEAALLKANADDARTRALRGEILFARALKAYDGKDYRQSLALLTQAEALGKSGRETSMLRAWNEYQLGDDAQAAPRFVAAYRALPDQQSAQGAVLSLSRAGRWDELAAYASSLGEPFKTEWQAALSDRYYGRKLFLAAEAAAPGHFPQLRNIDTATVALGAMIRDKSGDQGTSKLRITKAPYLEGTLGFKGTDELRLQLYRVELDSGTLPANAQVGSFPAVGGYVTAPTTRLNNGFEPHLSYKHEGWLTTYAGIGLTPTGGAVSSAPVGNLGVLKQTGRGNWRAEAFSDPVRESILSYTGIVDPYTGQSWGRVRRTGALVGGYTAISERWGAGGQLRVMHLGGDNVAGNEGATLNLSLARNLGLRGFDYFSIGPDLTYDTYRRNLSHFTIGHGGYFSPESLLSVGLSAHFLTLEARQFSIKGDASIGLFDKREAASPCFPLGAPLPLNPGCAGGYAATSATGFYYAAELLAVRRVSDHLQVGGGVIVRRNPQYQDKAAMVFVRYVFGARGNVMSSDLPVEVFRSLY